MEEYVDLNTNYGKTGLDLDTAFTTVAGNGIAHAYMQFDEVLCAQLQLFCKEYDTNEIEVLLAAFNVLLHRYNKPGDITVKNFTDKYSLADTTVLHTAVNGDTFFTDLLGEIKAAIVIACEKDSNSPVDNNGHSKTAAPGRPLFAIGQVDAESITKFESTFDLAFNIVESLEFGGVIAYRKEVYKRDTIEQIIAHYQQLLYSIVKDPHQMIGALPMLTPAGAHQLMEVFNGTVKPYQSDKTIVDIFEQQVINTPRNIALYLGDQTMTYDELNKRANQLARYLIGKGVKQEDNVGLLVGRNFNMIVGMFAILKAGAAYVPVLPDYPADRQQYMIKQSNVKYLLFETGCTLKADHVTAIDMLGIPYEQYDTTNIGLKINSKQLAYTIYTSGSTGVPKGVMIEHHSAINLITWVNTEFHIGADDRLLFITSMGFDLSVYDIFGMLAAGGGVVIAQKEEVLNFSRLAEMLQEHRITFWDSVPSTLDFLVSRLEATNKEYRQNYLRLVFLSGDWIPVALPEKIKNYFSKAEVISLGGATEGTVWSNYYPVEKVEKEWRSIPYGRPIDNNSFYILNEQLQPVPDGVIGELFIGGVGVARGYANDATKTRNAFLSDPFTAQWGGRMYRTGDLGRMLPGGIMEFIGRKDSQVKIRGYRVELGEIESVIRQCKSVSNAAVLLSPDKKQLVGYIVPGMYYDRDTVIAYVRRKVPDYMVPGKWVELDEMPLTQNGKIDTKSLQNADSEDKVRGEFAAPRNELEQKIAAVWCEILGLKEIGINDNFFDLGGQSLMAVELINEIERKIDRSLPVNILYKCPTIAQLSDFVQQEETAKGWKSLVTVKPTGSKTPVYMVHGDGLSLSNFHNLAQFVDPDQPVFSLQPVGLNGIDAPLENIADIAKHYISEIVEHNPAGPYLLGGYSFGGFVAIEMKRQLEEMGRSVKMLAIFDTDAEHVTYKKSWAKALPKRIKRQVPKFLFISRSMVTQPVSTIKYQYGILSKKINNLFYSLGLKEKPELRGVNKHISKIDETNMRAFRNYQLIPFDDKVYLFKAKSRLYFVDDFEYLGWTNYAREGVVVYDVPGDHKTMFQPPNVSELGRLLQHALDHCQ